MYPIIDFFGFTIYTYSVMAILGFAAVFIFCIIRCRQTGIDLEDTVCMIALAIFGLVIFALILYWMTRIKDIIRLLPYIFTRFSYFRSQIGIGLVFYGGLFGAFVGCIIYGKLLRKDIRDMLQMTVPCIPLFHFFGRLGCFFGGCCHGIENERFGIAYTNSVSAINGVPYLPIQLYEAIGNLIIFIVLLIRDNKARSCYEPIGIYAVSYGVMRFVLEFFRGDSIRGHLGALSTSQWISIILIPIGIYCLVCPPKKNILNKLFSIENE